MFGHRLKWKPSDKQHISSGNIQYRSVCVCVCALQRENKGTQLYQYTEGGEESGEGERQVSGIFRRGIQSALCVNAEPMTRGGRKIGEWIISESACYKA